MRVVAFESRQAEPMAALIRRRGGEPLIAPSMREVPLCEHAAVFAFGQKLFAGEIDLLICMTGVGTRILIDALSSRYPAEKVLSALGNVAVVARGPKPVKVLKEKRVPITLVVPEPNTWVEIVQALDLSERGIQLEGKAVALQEYGVSNQRLISALRKRGAEVHPVPVYRWALPEDVGPLTRAIEEIAAGRTDVTLWTNAAQVRHVLQVAAEKGLEAPLRRALERGVIASIGPTTTEALQGASLSVDFEPSHPKMGILVGEALARAEDLLREKRATWHLKGLLGSAPFGGSGGQAPSGGEGLRRDSLFLKACRREPTEATPVWLMRQAGRYLPEYRKLRARVPFLTLCKDPERAAEITLMAVDALRPDAAILFSDLLLVAEPMGLGLEYGGENGPVVAGSLTDLEAVDRLGEIRPRDNLAFVFEAVRRVRRRLDPRLPLIGFCGAPFTLASYLIEGGASRSFLHTKRLMAADTGAWDALMEKLTRGLIEYLNGQIEAGADAVQVFDTWVGCLSPADYRERVLPHTRRLIEGIAPGVPVIHFGTGNTAFLKEFRQAGGDVIGVDFRVELDAAWKAIGHDVGIQGNLDPAALCGPVPFWKERTRRILEQAGSRPGHIFNLGHGVLPMTPPEAARALIEEVHEVSRRLKSV